MCYFYVCTYTCKIWMNWFSYIEKYVLKKSAVVNKYKYAQILPGCITNFLIVGHILLKFYLSRSLLQRS